MRYGTFDDAQREYVIDNPDTPMSWVNYLGTSGYCGIISNNAAGYAFKDSAKSGRFLRFRFNSVPTDRPGRYIYLRDDSTGDYWSATWQPVGKPLDKYRSVCRHGMGYSTFESHYDGIRSDLRIFVPIDKHFEIWETMVTNESDRPRELSIFAYAEFCFWDMMQDLTNFQYILYTCRMDYSDDVVDYSTLLWPSREPKGFLASTQPVTSFDTDRDVFLGRYRDEGRPIAVEKGNCSGSIAQGGTPCGAVQNRVTLQPGETYRVCYVCGIGDAKQLGMELRDRFRDPAEVEKEFEGVRTYWNAHLGKFQCETPSPLVNTMVNVWNPYQCVTTFNWSRSASFNEAGGRDGLGFRDSNQDTLGAVHMTLGRTRAKIVELLRAQYANGGAMHSVQPLEWRQGAHNIESETYSDDHLWLLLSIPSYIRETGDFAFVDELVEFADEGEGTVLEHLIRALEFSNNHLGPHGFLLGLRADWNDCINLRGKGESLFSTFLFLKGIEEFRLLSDRLGRGALAEPWLQFREEMCRRVAELAWDGDWYLRGFLDSGKKLGGRESEQSFIFINSQTWAVIGEVGTRERAIRAMDSLHEHLATPHGIVINYPAFRHEDIEIGAITSFPPGLKENSGIFCHANTWAVVAEAMLGRGDEAMKLYLSFLPAAKNDQADLYTMEPYAYSQFITGKEHPYHFGRARNSWLTGTASWGYVSITQYILGVKADYDGLIVSPTIPAAWDGFSVRREFRGAIYEIDVTNPDHVCHGIKSFIVNGVEVAEKRAPLAQPGQTLKVQVVLG
ncbi:MAG: hypothetical protein P4L46_10235 [Fimbriimonas sp.]|nr:hypothetical protein [Fimbriimonas sp.]